jgi:putative transposase
MCIVLDIPRSSYYEKVNRKTSKTEIRREEIKKEVKSIYKDSKCRYGAPKIHKVLESKDVKCSMQLVQRIMKSEGIKSIVFKKYKHQNSKPSPAPAGNILSREFEAKGLGEKIVGDITYIKTEKDGWCYLASFIDLYSKRVVGWAYDKNMTTELVLKALGRATTNVEIKEGCILHTDLGSQYTSEKYTNIAKDLGFTLSYSRKGNPYDNACIESFHAIIKKECIYTLKLKDFEESRKVIFEYIESWYNRKRIHSKLGYLSPIEFEKKYA